MDGYSDDSGKTGCLIIVQNFQSVIINASRYGNIGKGVIFCAAGICAGFYRAQGLKISAIDASGHNIGLNILLIDCLPAEQNFFSRIAAAKSKQPDRKGSAGI